MVAGAFAEAWLDVYTIDGSQLAGQAASLAIALADATDVALLQFMHRIDASSSTCAPNINTLCSRAVAKAVACVLARASFFYESVEAAVSGDAGGVVSSDGVPVDITDVQFDAAGVNTTLVMSQCSQSFAGAVSDDAVSLADMADMCAAATDGTSCVCQADEIPWWNSDGSVSCVDCCLSNLPCCAGKK